MTKYSNLLEMSITKVRVLSYLYTMGFRENLKSELEYSGMLVKELSAKSGVNKKTLDSYLMKNGFTPSIKNAVNIAKALGVTVEYLITGTETKETKIESKRTKPLPLKQPKDLQEVLQIYEKLSVKDRYVVLSLARLLKDR